MRVLWISNPCGYKPAHQTSTAHQTYNQGGWQRSTLYEIKKRTDIEIGVCFAMDGQPFKVVQDGIVYYPHPNHKKLWKDKMLDILYYKCPKRDEILWGHYKDCFKRVIDDFRPDVIEIYGAECYQGLASLVASCPVLLHLQGFLSLYIYTSLQGYLKKAIFFRIGI